MNRDEYEKGKGKKPDVIEEFNERIRKEKAKKAEEKTTVKEEKDNAEVSSVNGKVNGGMNKNDIEIPPAYEPGIMFPAGKGIWVKIFTGWIITGLVIIVGIGLISYAIGWGFSISPLVILSYIIVFIAWLIAGAKIIRGIQRAKSEFFGAIMPGVIGPGITFTVYPYEKLTIWPTTLQTLPLTDPGKPAGIQTKTGEEEQIKEDGAKIKVPIPKVILEVDPVFVFQWPWKDEELTATMRNAPPPDRLDLLKDLIEEPVLDVIRTAGGQRDYVWITQNRTTFAEEVKELFKEHKDLASLINLLNLKNSLPSFKHINTPEPIKAGQSAEAASYYTGRADRIKAILQAEGQKLARILAGEGEASYQAAVRTAILKVLTSKDFADVAMKVEGMKTFVDASQGGKGTIIFPTELLSTLGGLLGSKSTSNVLGDLAKAGVSEEKLAEIIRAVLASKKE
ncbi:MAG: hypothetical protein V1732_03940 [Patescibacteria group bacterium]